MIEIYLLEQLAAFAECGTLSAAADRLHLTQPSLSRAMQKLEDEVGVPLFDRGKNKLTLNETGRMAAEYAKRILDMDAEMERHLKAFDKSRHTIAIGSVAPGPLMKLLPQASGAFDGSAITSEIATEDALLKGLKDSTYQIAVLSHPVEDEGYESVRYMKEHLNLSVPIMHPASSYKTITFKEMDGQNFIMYANVGVWEPIVRKMMPNAKFFKQDDLEALDEITKASSLPSFSTDVTLEAIPERRDRINVPFSDPEAEITFYLVYPKSEERRLEPLIESIKK